MSFVKVITLLTLITGTVIAIYSVYERKKHHKELIEALKNKK